LTGLAAVLRITRVKSRTFLLMVALGFAAGCAVPAGREPENLGRNKAAVIGYQQSGDYARDLEKISARATAWIERRAARRIDGERLAVIFDLDETLLSNWPHILEDDFSYISPRWHAWVGQAKATAITPVRETFRASVRAGVAVIVLTGRREYERAVTGRNLRQEEMAGFTRLVLRPDKRAADEVEETNAVFKTAMRKALVAEGWTIVANIGDQDSDLSGGYAERTFKLPNPFYLTE